jgi:hypothetical protein
MKTVPEPFFCFWELEKVAVLVLNFGNKKNDDISKYNRNLR